MDEKIARWGRQIKSDAFIIGSFLKKAAIKGLEESCNNPEAIQYLSEALSLKDMEISGRAQSALSALTAQPAIDRLIDLVIDDHERSHLASIVDTADYRHSDEGRWHLYLIVAGRFDDYLAEDFEFQRLRAEFRAASMELQGRIRESIVKKGDARMSPLFVAERREKVLADLTDKDAEVLLKVNIRNRNWDDLLRYVWVLPARYIVNVVQAMDGAGWTPDDPDRSALYARLKGLAGGTDGIPSGGVSLMANPVFREWFERGEEGDFAQKNEKDLRALLDVAVPPQDQVSALATLKKTGGLTEADIAKAAESPHWIVRIAAITLGGPYKKPNDGAMLWFERLMPVLDQDALWEGKPCDVTREGLEALRKGLQSLPDQKAAGGLPIIEAVASHYMAHDIEIEIGAHVFITEDSFEIEG